MIKLFRDHPILDPGPCSCQSSQWCEIELTRLQHAVCCNPVIWVAPFVQTGKQALGMGKWEFLAMMFKQISQLFTNSDDTEQT